MGELPAVSEIQELFSSQDGEAKSAFITSLPADSMRDPAASLASTDSIELGIAALESLTIAYGYGAQPEVGLTIALAAMRLRLEQVKVIEPEHRTVAVTAAARSCNVALEALGALERGTEALALADELIPWFEAENEAVNLNSIKLHRAEALMRLRDTGAAEAALAPFRSRDLPFSERVFFERLANELDGTLDSVLKTKLSAAVTPTPQEHGEILDTLSKGTEFMSRGSEGMNRWLAQEQLRLATAIFVDPVAGRDHEKIRESESVLRPLLDWLRAEGLTDDEKDVLWGLYLCYSRLGEPEAAIESVDALIRNLDTTRARITNPADRAAVYEKYPYALPVLCGLYWDTDQTDGLLLAIERGKGRALADHLLIRTGANGDERPDEYASSVAKLPRAMTKAGVHYLTFLVDEERTFAALVAKDGSVHYEAIPLGDDQLKSWLPFVDPVGWGKRDLDSGFSGGGRNPTLSQELEPLLSWLEPLSEQGLLAKGDHLVYAPDSHLHNFPIHYVRFRGQPLGLSHSVSRTHGAQSLLLLLDRTIRRPQRFVSVDVANATDEGAVLEGIKAVPAWLRSNLDSEPEDSLSEQDATVRAIQSLPLSGRVVHFATHGVFPSETTRVRDPNPYESAGVVLANSEGLPKRERIAAGHDLDCILSPRKIDEMDLTLDGAHVTLQACVTGKSTEGRGGDALGLEWAMLLHGASSVLSSHWNLKARQSARFCQNFYENWLHQGLSRAEAWHAAALDAAGTGATESNSRDWAAFSLSGDWR